MSKYYKLIKDHPLWEVGAIMSNSADKSEYQPVNELFTKELKEGHDYSDFYEQADIVEFAPEWFERVYKHKVVGTVKYLSKDAAKKLHAELYK